MPIKSNRYHSPFSAARKIIYNISSKEKFILMLYIWEFIALYYDNMIIISSKFKDFNSHTVSVGSLWSV